MAHGFFLADSLRARRRGRVLCVRGRGDPHHRLAGSRRQRWHDAICERRDGVLAAAAAAQALADHYRAALAPRLTLMDPSLARRPFLRLWRWLCPVLRRGIEGAL